jgi:hypothetical protein
MSIGGMDCCSDSQRGEPYCPDGFHYYITPGSRNGQCYPNKSKNNGSDQRRTVSPYQWPQDKRGTNLGNRITRWILNQLYALTGVRIPIPPDGAKEKKHT